MKKMMLAVAAIIVLSVTIAVAADHSGHNMGHGGHDMGHNGNQGDVVHNEVVDGVKATFRVISMKEHMKAMSMKMPEDMKETHHIAVEFKDAKSSKVLTEGEVKVKVQNPDKSDQSKDLVGMQGHFGGDFDLSKKGKYGVMCKFKLKDGKTRSAKFWYTAK